MDTEESAIEMQNFNEGDYQFLGPLANTGYKQYMKNKKQSAILVESKLSERIIGINMEKEVKFTNIEMADILQ